LSDINIKLWGIKSSPFVRKVMVVLYEKNIDFQQIEVMPSSFAKVTRLPIQDRFQEISPCGRIPAIEVNNFYIADSAVINQYLEHKFVHTNKLYPKDPDNYAKALWLERFSDNDLAKIATRRIFYEAYAKPLAFGKVSDQDLLKKAIDTQLPPLLEYLETQIKDKQYFIANNFSIADIAITTQLLALEMANFELNRELYPALCNYYKNIKTRPSIAKISSALT